MLQLLWSTSLESFPAWPLKGTSSVTDTPFFKNNMQHGLEAEEMTH